MEFTPENIIPILEETPQGATKFSDNFGFLGDIIFGISKSDIKEEVMPAIRQPIKAIIPNVVEPIK